MAGMLVIIGLTIAASVAAMVMDSKQARREFNAIRQEYNDAMEVIHGYTANKYKI